MISTLLIAMDVTTVWSMNFLFQSFLGGLISAFIGIILTILIFPYLENVFQAYIVSKLDFLKISSKHKIAGLWTHKWHVNSKNFPQVNETKNVQIKQFRSRIFVQYEVIDLNNKKYIYQMLGKVERDQIITGTWKDVKKGNRYHGCFQIYIDINEQSMNGYWTGVSRETQIKSDKWEWIRQDDLCID